MKKLLTILLALLILVACGKKDPSYEDVAADYEQLKQEAIAVTENYDSYLKADYLSAVEEISELVTNLEKSLEETNIENLKKICKLTYAIEYISAQNSGEAANRISRIANAVDALAQATYDATEEDFATAKQNVLDKIALLDELTNKDWATAEKKTLLKWEDVEDAYDELVKEAKSEMTDAKEVTEAELDDLKNDIIDKYEEIAYGVTVYNEDHAKDIYADAAILEAYTRKTTSEQGKTVRYFAIDTMSYVKQCYGKVLDESEALEQDYPLSIADAKKWTQSVWNYITTELKK